MVNMSFKQMKDELETLKDMYEEPEELGLYPTVEVYKLKHKAEEWIKALNWWSPELHRLPKEFDISEKERKAIIKFIEHFFLRNKVKVKYDGKL